MADKPRLTSLSVSEENRVLAKHIAVASRSSINEVAGRALRLLQREYGLSDPPQVKQPVGAE